MVKGKIVLFNTISMWKYSYDPALTDLKELTNLIF